MSLQQLIAAYLSGIDAVRRAVAGMTAEQLRARPIHGKWNTLEVVCHIADFELIDAVRITQTLAEDRPVIFDIDERRLAATLAYHQREANEELAVIEATRRHVARILGAQSDSVLARQSTFRIGERSDVRTLERHLVLATEHIPHHVRFILEKRRALGLHV